MDENTVAMIHEPARDALRITHSVVLAASRCDGYRVPIAVPLLP